MDVFCVFILISIIRKMEMEFFILDFVFYVLEFILFVNILKFCFLNKYEEEMLELEGCLLCMEDMIII